CSDNSQTLLTNQIRTDEFELNEEFLLKPSDEDGDWVIGDPSPPSAAAAAPPAAAAATEDSSASTSTSFCEAENRNGPEAEAQNAEVEADAEPEVEAEADPEAEADNAVANNASTLPKNAFRFDERSEALLTELRHALHTVYSAVSYAQYDFDVLVEDWARRVVVFESDGVWCRGRVLNYVREQGLFFLLDIDTGYSKVMPTAQHETRVSTANGLHRWRPVRVD
uniref:Tudor domain-containing protein n=1 Tax=Macrostomum lignano TaxID=282301 RepID=A0A1I8FGK7_9PLAT